MALKLQQVLYNPPKFYELRPTNAEK